MITLVRAVLVRVAREEIGKRRVLVLGAGKRAAALSCLRRRTDLIGIRTLGYVRYAGDEPQVAPERIIELDRPLRLLVYRLEQS